MSYAAMNSPMTKNKNGQTLAQLKSRESPVFVQHNNPHDMSLLSRLQLCNSAHGNEFSLMSSLPNNVNHVNHVNNVAYVSTMPTMSSMPSMPQYISSPLMQLPMLCNDESTLVNQNSNVQSKTSLNSLKVSDAPADELVVARKTFDCTSSLANALFPLSRKQGEPFVNPHDVLSCVNDLHTGALCNKQLMENVCQTVGNLHEAGLQNKHIVAESLHKMSKDVKNTNNSIKTLSKDNKQFHDAFENHTKVLKQMDQGLKHFKKTQENLISKVKTLEDSSENVKAKAQNTSGMGELFDLDHTSAAGKKNKKKQTRF